MVLAGIAASAGAQGLCGLQDLCRSIGQLCKVQVQYILSGENAVCGVWSYPNFFLVLPDSAPIKLFRGT